jgi:hypothetical protein
LQRLNRLGGLKSFFASFPNFVWECNCLRNSVAARTGQREMKFREEQETFPNKIWERGDAWPSIPRYPATAALNKIFNHILNNLGDRTLLREVVRHLADDRLGQAKGL